MPTDLQVDGQYLVATADIVCRIPTRRYWSHHVRRLLVGPSQDLEARLTFFFVTEVRTILHHLPVAIRPIFLEYKIVVVDRGRHRRASTKPLCTLLASLPFL